MITIILEVIMLGRNIYNYGISLHYYVQLYLILLITSILLLVALKAFESIRDQSTKIHWQSVAMYIFYTIVLFWGVIVTIVDQKSYGHVTAYLTNLMTVSALFVTPRRKYILLHLFPIVFLVIGFIFYQDNYKVIIAHMINITVFIIFCILGAMLMYRNTRKMYVQELELSLKNKELENWKTYFETLSVKDDLTQLLNYRGMKTTIENLTKNESKKLSVIILDIDAFKQYNDHYGHMLGNEVLYTVARVLKEVIDPQNEMVARFGGEEFVIVTPNTDQHAVYALAEKVRKNVLALEIEHKQSPICHHVTVSVGYAIGEVVDEQSFDRLLNEADAYLYEAKKSTRNTVCPKI